MSLCLALLAQVKKEQRIRLTLVYVCPFDLQSRVSVEMNFNQLDSILITACLRKFEFLVIIISSK